jgi:Bacterial Ig-like domain
MANLVELITRPVNGGAPKKTAYKVGEAAKAEGQTAYSMLVDGQPVPKGTKIIRKSGALRFEFPDGTDWCSVNDSKLAELIGSSAYQDSTGKFVDIREVGSGACALVAADGSALGALGAPSVFGLLGALGALGLVGLAASGGGSSTAAAVAITGELALGSVSAAGGNVTNSDKPSLSGKALAGDRVTVKLPNGETLTTTADAQGNWAITPTQALAQGPITAEVSATSSTGTVRAPVAISFVVDSIAPTAPTILAVPENADGYVSGADATNGTPVQVNIAETGAKVGDTITLNWGGQKVTQILTAANIAAGTVTVEVPNSLITAQGNGNVAVTASITDTAGNVGNASAASTALVALNAPAAAPDLITADDSGSSSADNTTRVVNPAFTITAPTAAGTTAVLIIDGVVVPSTVTTTNGVTQLIPSTALSNGPHTVAVAFVAADGVQSPSSPALNVIIDTVLPVAGAGPVSLAPASDTGSSSSDAITGDTTPSYVVPAPPAGETPNLYVDGVLVASTYDPVTGTVTPVTPLAIGTYQISVGNIDTAGNAGPRSPNQALTIVATAAAPGTAPDMTLGTDLGSSTTDNLTSDTTPSFAVAAPPAGQSVVLLVDGVAVAATYDSAAGTVTPNAALSHGAHSITYAFADASGQSGLPSTALAINIDSVFPTAPTAQLATASDSGVAGDGRTSDITPDVTGTGVAGNTITVTMPSTGEVLTTVVAANGTWSVTPAQAIASGTTGNATVTSTDPAGNVSPAVNVAITIDTAGPTLQSSSPVDNATGVPSSSTVTLTFNETVSFGTGTITLFNTDTGSAVETFNVATGVGSNGGTISVSGGTVTLNLAAATQGNSNYNVQMSAGAVRDAAANNGAAIADATTLNFATFTFTAPNVTASNLAKTTYSEYLHTINSNLVNSNAMGYVPGTNGFGNEVVEFTSVDDTSKVVSITPAYASGLNWFGTVYNEVGIGTNGYITFGHLNNSYSAVGLNGYTVGGMIAAQFDDWDSRLTGSKPVAFVPATTVGGNSLGTNKTYFAAYNNEDGGVVTLTYDDVAAYTYRDPAITDGLTVNNYSQGNAEQIRLVRTASGETVIQIVYENVNWINGNTGLPTGGWTKGDGATFGLVDGNIPGASSGGISSTNNFLDVELASNVGINGVYEWMIDSNGNIANGAVPIISTHSAVAQDSTQLSADAPVTYAQSTTAWDSRFTLVGSKIVANGGASFAPTETQVDLTVVVTDTASGGTFNKIVSIQLFDQIGGIGNDLIGIRNAADISKLTGAVASQVVMNGNGGEDTLIFTGTGLNLDLTGVQNTALINVERIELGSGNTLLLSIADVFAMGSSNQFNSGNGWVGLGASVAAEQLVIDGNASDTVRIAELTDWNQVSAGTVTNDGHSYNVYNSNSGAGQLLIDQTIGLAFLAGL